MNINFRELKASEIECRVAMIKENGISLLLYKDARVDMRMLDETVGPMNWKREHSRDNANCTVSIWDEDKKQWISKEDTGTESNTEAAKGLASDSFKRACFNWGVGRELYSAPFIWISSSQCKIVQGRNGKLACYDRFAVESIEYDENRDITSLTIVNQQTRAVVYQYGKTGKPVKIVQSAGNETITESQIKTLIAAAEETETNILDVINHFRPGGTLHDFTARQYGEALNILNKKRMRQEQGA